MVRGQSISGTVRAKAPRWGLMICVQGAMEVKGEGQEVRPGKQEVRRMKADFPGDKWFKIHLISAGGCRLILVQTRFHMPQGQVGSSATTLQTAHASTRSDTVK